MFQARKATCFQAQLTQSSLLKPLEKLHAALTPAILKSSDGV
jgi:hypothetical protein